MKTFSPTLQSVEEYLDHLKASMRIRAANVPTLEELDETAYRAAVQKVKHWDYLQSADYHYFVSRILFLRHVPEYSLFSGHQCIENYLKAYLKWKGQLPPNSHNLAALLQRCRSVAPNSDAFIHDERADIILAKYAPFYEFARYSVQRTRPKGGYALFFPDDVYVLDYFVFRMRTILTIPSNTWDILKEGHFSLANCKRLFPGFYALFFQNNINFDSAPETERRAG